MQRTGVGHPAESRQSQDSPGQQQPRESSGNPENASGTLKFTVAVNVAIKNGSPQLDPSVSGVQFVPANSLPSPAPEPDADRPAAALKLTAPRYSLRKGLGVWYVIFAGNPTDIRHERGMFYVAYLLLNPPNEPIHALDLMAKIPQFYRQQLGLPYIADPATGKAITLGSDARIQERSLALDDVETMRRLYRRQRELEAILDSDDASEPEKAEALREYEQITEFLRHHSCRTKDNAQNAADTVRTGIWRLQRRLLRATDR